MPINVCVYNPVSFICRLTNVSAIFILTVTRRAVKSYLCPPLPPWYSFGFMVGYSVGLQIGSGLVLACNYRPGLAAGFASIRSLVQDSLCGFIIQGIHQNGASVVMWFVILHSIKSFYYSQTLARMGFIGHCIYVTFICICFTGYSCAASQMSY